MKEGNLNSIYFQHIFSLLSILPLLAILTFSASLFFGYRYVVDAADWDSVPIAKSELFDLLAKPSLNGIPLLVVGNKIDKSEALPEQALVEQL